MTTRLLFPFPPRRSLCPGCHHRQDTAAGSDPRTASAATNDHELPLPPLLIHRTTTPYPSRMNAAPMACPTNWSVPPNTNLWAILHRRALHRAFLKPATVRLQTFWPTRFSMAQQTGTTHWSRLL